MKTIEVRRFSTGEICHVHDIFCECERGKDSDGNFVYIFYVWGKTFDICCSTCVLISSFRDLVQAMDLVDHLKAQLKEVE